MWGRSSTWLLDGAASDGGWLAAGEQPAGRDGRPWNAHDYEDEIEHRYPTEIGEVVEVRRDDNDVGAGDAEERAQEGEPAGGGGGQGAADAAGGSGRGQGAEGAGGRRDRAELRVGRGLALYLDRQAGVGRELVGVGDLFARQRPARLDEPARRDLFPAAAAESVDRDERGRRTALSLGRAEELPAVDPLDVCDGLFGHLGPAGRPRRRLLADRDELVGRDGSVGQEVRAGIDCGGVDSDVPEQGGRGYVQARFSDVAARSWAQAQHCPP